LHLDERSYSPELQRRLVETTTATKSFKQAALMAKCWADLTLSARHVARIVEEIGMELVEKRDAEVKEFVHHRRGAEGPDPEHELAAVFVDGGRVQTREEGQGVGVHDPHWRENKVARLQTMTTRCHSEDPCPEPPACFGDFGKLERFLGDKQAQEKQASVKETLAAEAAPRWQPETLVRTCVATMHSVDDFRWMVMAEAKRRHFFTAKKRAFVADGAAYNWTMRAAQFPDFVPILDFLHLAGYLYAAAKAFDPATVAERYRTWVRDAWQGRAADVLAELQRRLVEAGIGDAPLPEEHPLRPVQKAATYLANHAEKTDYPRYRREGLPCTSSLIESQIKEFNARLKGSEKFWNKSNAESMLQLIAWGLREDGPTLRDHFANRPGCVFRRRSSGTESTASPHTVA
jgi:hypothetical protein